MQNLDDLVCQAESIATNLEDDEVPHIHRNIEQLRKRGETFYNRAAQNDIKAAKLLGNKVGYELSNTLSKTLESLNVVPSYDGVCATNIEDIPSFLKNERETAILSAVNLARNNTLSASYQLCEQAKADWWRAEKNNILNLMLNSDKLPSLLATATATGLSTRNIALNSPSSENVRFTKSLLSRDETQYSREIARFVDDSLGLSSGTDRPRSLAECLLLEADSTSSPLATSKCPELCEIRRLLASYCQAQPVCNALADQRHGDGDLSRRLLETAIRHLELEYEAYIGQCIGTGTGTAGGGDARAVAQFVATQLLDTAPGVQFEDATVHGVPVWPLLYCCLRAGLVRQAVAVARATTGNLGAEFPAFLEAWALPTSGVAHGHGHGLSEEQTRRVTHEYKRHVRASTDPYKRLVYALLAGVPDTDGSSGTATGTAGTGATTSGTGCTEGSVLATVDDFLWARLTLLAKTGGGGPIDQHPHQSGGSLAALQSLIADEYGEAHFQAAEQPLNYCRVLLLCQMLEPALAFLARFEHLRCHAVHLTLALWQSNLLLVSTGIEAPLLSRHEDDPEGAPCLNLVRLVTVYTRKFEAQHPREALDLFYVLADHLGGFVECATTLALESGDQLELFFGRLLQHVPDDHAAGLVTRGGLLARYGPGCAGEVLRAVSTRLRQAGRSEAACDALQLAGEFAEAARELAELLATTVAPLSATSAPAPGGQGQHPHLPPGLARLQTKAEALLTRLGSRGAAHSCPDSALLAAVLAIARFIIAAAVSTSSSSHGDVDSALARLDDTGLLPTSSDAATVRTATDAFRRLPELVRSLFPGLLVAAMRTLKSAAFASLNMPQQLAEVRARAVALITFTGQLPYRMPADVYAGLSQLELEIN